MDETTDELISKCRELIVTPWTSWVDANPQRMLTVDLDAGTLRALAECLNRLEKREAENAEQKAALGEMIYDTTHLSPAEDDGSHKCQISAEALMKARRAYWQTPDGKKPGEPEGGA